MLNNHASDVSGNGRIAPFLVSSSQAAKELHDRAQIVHRTFTLLGRGNAFIACCVVVLFLVMSSSARLAAQTSGVISGHVADATGAVIPNANVTLTNVGTSAERSTVTTGAGDYTFPDVPPAIYKVQVTHAGFKTETSEALELQVQQSLRQDFTMQVGAVTATVTVEATGALLQVENASARHRDREPGHQRDAAERQKLPVTGCSFVQRQHAFSCSLAKQAAASAAIAPASRSRSAANASCGTITRSTA